MYSFRLRYFQSDFDTDDDLTVFGTTMEDDSDAERVSTTQFTAQSMRMLQLI